MTVLVIDIQRANEEFERDKNKPILSTRKGFERPWYLFIKREYIYSKVDFE